MHFFFDWAVGKLFGWGKGGGLLRELVAVIGILSFVAVAILYAVARLYKGNPVI
jgi:hypothetical protein